MPLSPAALGLLLIFPHLPACAEESAQSALLKALPGLRLSREDLAIRADRWDTRMTLPAVEGLLQDPLAATGALSDWSARLKDAPSSFALAELAAGMLDAQAVSGSSEAAQALLSGWESTAERPDLRLSTQARTAIGGILSAIALAQPLLERAVSSLSPDERRKALATMQGLVFNEDAGGLASEDFEVLSRFDLASLLSAARRVLRAVDAALPALKSAVQSAAGLPRTRVSLPIGDLLLSGGGDDEYSEEDLRDAALLVDFGGRSRYHGPPAAAGEGKIRVGVDLSREVFVESSSGAASGVFGIGLLYLPEEGVKSLHAGDISLGAGLFGVGGLFMAGEGSSLLGGRFTQGAGAFGIGLLDLRGKGAAYSLRLAGQGFGSTRGAGILRHRGDGARLDGGETEADPREPLAALSLSQGAGYGPRAYSAGGVGLALVEGDGCELRASYMAQGMGYWHSFGGLAVLGGGNRIQGRRYVQGAGVHTAVGGLRLAGSGNSLMTWGVGPGFGWDYGVGSLDAQGEGNSFSSEWASGRGDVNGHGFVSIRGSRNRVALADLGSGAFKRGAPSYGVVSILGEGNAYRFFAASGTAGPLTLGADPWGALSGDEGLRVEGELPMPKPDWPGVPREEAFLRDRERLVKLIREADGKAVVERLKDWLRAAASAGLDAQTGMEAARRLASLPGSERRHLLRLVSADDFSGLIWLRLLLPAFGRDMASAALREYQSERGMRRALLLGLFSQMPAADAMGPALLESRSPDWRLRRQSALILGKLFDRGKGQEPGRIRLLETAAMLCARPEERGKKDAAWLSALGEQSLSDLFAALSLGEGMAPEERVSLLFSNPNPFEPASPAALREFARILGSREKRYAAALASESEELSSQEGEARRALKALLQDSDREVAAAALSGLGGIGRKEDAPALAAFLEDPSALLREASAAALGRMGDAARGEIRKALRSRLPRTRALAAAAAARSGEASALLELKAAFRDKDEEVRRTALAALLAVQNPLRGERKAFAGEVRRLLSDKAPSVRAAARRALAEVR